MTIFYRNLFYGLVAVALLQSVFYYPQLPAVVASHFDGAGIANGWSSRNVFFTVYLVMVAMVTQPSPRINAPPTLGCVA